MRHVCTRRMLYILTALLFVAGMVAADKQDPVVQRVYTTNPVPISPQGVAPRLRAGDSCTTNLAGPAAYYIYPWIVGDELYKAYQDPSVTCDKPYPFTVEAVYLPLVYLDAGTVYISVDVEAVDLSNPSCPKPDTLIAISPLYEVALENNFYLIEIPFDTPAVVTGPYFVGVYFANMGNPAAAAIVTDTIPVPCVSYNDWGEGYVDLDTIHNNYGEEIFPGRVIIYSGGTTGGSGGSEPAPAARIINPAGGEFLGNPVDLWGNDDAGSRIIDLARFQFFKDGGWLDIGSDVDDDPPLRNGVSPSGSGDGLTYLWNTVGLPENDYHLRVIVSDTLGRADTAGVTAHVDPTPPFPIITQPLLGQNVCNGAAAHITCTDEDLVYISFDRKSLPIDFSYPIPVINQQLGGDMNGKPLDGNRVAGGEFGDYCSGPAAAAMAVKYWFNKGYDYILSEGIDILTDVQLMDRLFDAMNIQHDLGAYDEEFITGLNGYILAHGNEFALKINRSPKLADLYSWLGNYEYAVMVGLSGTPGLWVTAAGATGVAAQNETAVFKMADPVSAAIGAYSVKEESGKLWMQYGGVWKEIDLLIGMVPKNWTVVRKPVGVDAIGYDGWGFQWNTSALSEDSLYFLHAVANDQAGHYGSASVLVQNDCSLVGLPGDINNDGQVNIADVVFMTNFLYLGGPPPALGPGVANVNCDGTVDLADLIYLFNYLCNSGPAPCE